MKPRFEQAEVVFQERFASDAALREVGPAQIVECKTWAHALALIGSGAAALAPASTFPGQNRRTIARHRAQLSKVYS